MVRNGGVELWVNGRLIINFIDTQDPIIESGYTGFSVTQGTVEIGRELKFIKEENCISNGTFETGTEHWTAKNANLIRDTSDSYTGNASAKVIVGSDFGAAYQRIRLEKNKQYTFSVWVKLVSETLSTDIAQIIIDHNLAGYYNPKYEYVATGTIVNSETWTELRGSYKYVGSDPESVADMCIRIGDGKKHVTYLFDDFTIMPSIPKVNLNSFGGEMIIGNPVTATYTYIDVNSGSEKNSIYRFVSADSIDSEQWQVLKEGISNSNDILSYTPKIEDFGKCIRLEIIPVSTADYVGTTYYSTPMSARAEGIRYSVNESYIDDGENFQLHINVVQDIQESIDAKIYVAMYNEDSLYDVKEVSLTLQNNTVWGDTITMPIPTRGVYKIKIFLWDKEDITPLSKYSDYWVCRDAGCKLDSSSR